MKVSLYWLLATLVLSPVNGSEQEQPARGSCVVDNDGACVVETDDENSHQLMDAAVADLFGVEQELLDAASMQHFEKSFGLCLARVDYCALGREDKKPTHLWTNVSQC